MKRKELKGFTKEELIELLLDEESDELPDQKKLKNELSRLQYKRRFRSVLLSTVYSLITVAAIAILVCTLFMPVLQIYGSSMEPNIEEGNIVIAVKDSAIKRGDIIAFYYGNKLLVKRCIGLPGDWITIDQNGNVFINDEKQDEPYLTEKALGNCDIEFPYQVPDNKYFVLGDNRSVSLDSRETLMGCVSNEQLAGRIVFRVWPLTEFGLI